MDKPHTDYRPTGIEAAKPAPLAGNLTKALIGNVRNYLCAALTCFTFNVTQGIPKGADAQRSGGLNRSSVEVSVMGMERRV